MSTSNTCPHATAIRESGSERTWLFVIMLGLLFASCDSVLSPKQTVATSSNNNLLSTLIMEPGVLSPAFDPATTEYTGTVANTVTSVVIRGTVADPTATVDPAAPLTNLTVGVAQTATITVTAQSGQKKVYRVTVTRAAPLSTNADLATLSLSNGALTPAFAPGTTAYTASVPYAVTSVVVTGTKADSNASVSSPMTLANLEVGTPQTATITVTSQNGTRRDYTVSVTRLAQGFSVTYVRTNSDSGAVPVDSNLYLKDTPVPIAGNPGKLQFEGFTFVGWNTDPRATSGLNTVTMGDSSIYLYPVWKLNPIQTRNFDGEYQSWVYAPSAGWTKVGGTSLFIGVDKISMDGTTVYPDPQLPEAKLGITNDGQIYLESIVNSEVQDTYLFDLRSDYSQYKTGLTGGTRALWMKLDNLATNNLAGQTQIDPDLALSQSLICWLPKGMKDNYQPLPSYTDSQGTPKPAYSINGRVVIMPTMENYVLTSLHQVLEFQEHIYCTGHFYIKGAPDYQFVYWKDGVLHQEAAMATTMVATDNDLFMIGSSGYYLKNELPQADPGPSIRASYTLRDGNSIYCIPYPFADSGPVFWEVGVGSTALPVPEGLTIKYPLGIKLTASHRIVVPAQIPDGGLCYWLNGVFHYGEYNDSSDPVVSGV